MGSLERGSLFKKIQGKTSYSLQPRICWESGEIRVNQQGEADVLPVSQGPELTRGVSRPPAITASSILTGRHIVKKTNSQTSSVMLYEKLHAECRRSKDPAVSWGAFLSPLG